MDTLRTFAEVAVALAGFTGIVGVLGRRAGGEWSPLELLRLRMLLETSLAVLFLALVPLLLLMLHPSADRLWRVSNAFQMLLHLVGAVALLVRVARLDPSQWPPEERWLTAVFAPLSALVLAAQAAVVLGFHTELGAFVYLLGLVYLLVLAVLHFVLLLLPGSR